MVPAQRAADWQPRRLGRMACLAENGRNPSGPRPRRPPHRATLLLAQGVDQRVVMEILGHSQISMTSRYAHVLPQVMTDAAERIGRALWGES